MHQTGATAARRRSSLAAIAVIGVLAVAMAACAMGAAPAGASPAGRDGDGAQAAGPSAPPEPGSETSGGGRGLAAAPIEQRIIKTGEVSVEVSDVSRAVARVRALTLELGGYVGGTQAGGRDESATLTLRIPAARFDDALARLHELGGEVVGEATHEEDVTGQIVDLEARIRNLRASEASYRELTARAQAIDDVLAVQTRLDQVRGEIEQLTAQLETLAGRADMSTLTVSLIPTSQPIRDQTEAWDPAGQLDRATAALVGIGQGFANGLIWFVVVWLPILLVLGLFVLLALRGVLEVRRRLPAPSGSGGTASPGPAA